MALSITTHNGTYIVAGVVVCNTWAEAAALVERAEELRREEEKNEMPRL